MNNEDTNDIDDGTRMFDTDDFVLAKAFENFQILANCKKKSDINRTVA